MTTTILGRVLFAIGVIGFGALSLVFGKFALQWQPVPEVVHPQLAYVSGAILIVAGLGLFLRNLAFVSALALAAFLALWVFALQFPLVSHNAGSVGTWLPLCEDLAMTCGAWVLMAGAKYKPVPFLTDQLALDVARLLFGLCCLVFGASHFVYADFTAQMVPQWLPEPLVIAYFTGACHCAAGVALVTGVRARLAATLEAVMMTGFLVLVHVPMVIVRSSGDVQLIWTMLFAACGMAGAAWLIAASCARDARPGS